MCLEMHREEGFLSKIFLGPILAYIRANICLKTCSENALWGRKKTAEWRREHEHEGERIENKRAGRSRGGETLRGEDSGWGIRMRVGGQKRLKAGEQNSQWRSRDGDD